MSVSMNFLVFSKIDHIEFNRFLLELGGRLDSDNVMKSEWNCEDAHIWMSREDSLIGEYEKEDLDEIKKRLGDIPQSLFVVELSSNNNSSFLATKLAYEMGLKWRIVVDDLYENMYSSEDVISLYENKKVFE